MAISAIPKEVRAKLAPPVNADGVGCATVGVVAFEIGDTPVPEPEGNAGRLGAIAEEDNVTVKADVDEELSTSVDVRVDVAVVDEVEEVEEATVVSVDPGMTVGVAVVVAGSSVAVAVVVAGSSVAEISMVPVLKMRVLVSQSRA